MDILELFKEGQVYEVLLVTESNVTPVGVVRKGERLFFKLFGGKSAAEIKERPKASIQITNDVELLVKLALNFPVDLEFEGKNGNRWIRNLPGVYGKVEFKEEPHRDELGETIVLKCSLIPEGKIAGKLPPKPISRADNYLLEMAVNLTRLLVAVKNGRTEAAERLYREVLRDHEMYRRFGGSSKTAGRMLSLSRDIFGH